MLQVFGRPRKGENNKKQDKGTFRGDEGKTEDREYRGCKRVDERNDEKQHGTHETDVQADDSILPARDANTSVAELQLFVAHGSDAAFVSDYWERNTVWVARMVFCFFYTLCANDKKTAKSRGLKFLYINKILD